MAMAIPTLCRLALQINRFGHDGQIFQRQLPAHRVVSCFYHGFHRLEFISFPGWQKLEYLFHIDLDAVTAKGVITEYTPAGLRDLARQHISGCPQLPSITLDKILCRSSGRG
ncbi:MAG: hypothetical protein WCJ49_03060 [Deltaproteobacteria bacterium]